MSSHAFSTPTSSPLDRRFLVPLLAAGFLLVAMLLCIGIGPVSLSPAQVWRALVSSETTSTADVIVRQIRLPRVLVGAMIAAAAHFRADTAELDLDVRASWPIA